MCTIPMSVDTAEIHANKNCTITYNMHTQTSAILLTGSKPVSISVGTPRELVVLRGALLQVLPRFIQENASVCGIR